MKYLLLIAIAALIAVPAYGDYTVCYSWEDGYGTILGYYGNVANPTNVTGPQTGLTGDVPPGTWTCPGACNGVRYLHVAESPHSGTPQVYLIWIQGLVDGDVVHCSYHGWDDLDRDGGNGEPALRIWAHYATADDIDNYQGSAGAGDNNTGYTTAVGWQQISADWTYGVSGSPYAGYASLVIEARLYSYDYTVDPKTTDYWIDYACATVPDQATAIFPEQPTPVEGRSWSTIKALYR